MNALNLVGAVQIATHNAEYVYDIIPLSAGLAALSSDNTLRLLDPHALSENCRQLKDVGQSVTCFQALDTEKLVAVAGRDGIIKIWDLRGGCDGGGYLAGQVRVGDNLPILSLASCSSFGLAAGSELTNDLAPISLWDLRKLETPLLKYDECHSEDVTVLQFHPIRPHILLSGSIDGLVNIYDTSFTDQDEALHQIINHDASIHHSNFLTDVDIFALSHDETFSIYELANDPDDEEDESSHTHFDDLRSILGGEYVAKLVGRPDGGAVMGIGTHSRETFELVQLKNSPPWTFALDEKVTLPGAHGTEIVRSFSFLDSHRTVFTCGEDGQIKAWRGD